MNPVRNCLLTTPRFFVEERTYTQPGSRAYRRTVVVHPGAVVILPFLDADTILMIRQFRHAPELELCELPAGTMEPDEPPIETARRELIEETGYRAGSIEPFLEFYTSPGIITERMCAFLATDLDWVGVQPDDGECISVQPTALERVRDQLRAGEFRDAKTIAVLGTYFARHGNP